jgi:hypothetical protein
MLRACHDAAYAISDPTDVTRPRTPAITVASFRSDPLFPRIERAVAAILRTSKVVTPIQVLVGMQPLTHEHVQDRLRGAGVSVGTHRILRAAGRGSAEGARPQPVGEERPRPPT